MPIQEPLSTINSPRRYYLLKRLITEGRDESIEAQWHAKQIEVAGTALPPSFPYLSLLGTYYTTVEDLNGANLRELRDFGLTKKQAEAVLEAAAPLIEAL